MLKIREIGKDFVPLDDVHSAFFDSNPLISIQYHGCSHVSSEALHCILRYNNLKHKINTTSKHMFSNMKMRESHWGKRVSRWWQFFFKNESTVVGKHNFSQVKLK